METNSPVVHTNSLVFETRFKFSHAGPQATTSFIEQHPELFHFSTRDSSSAAKLLSYLAELVRLLRARLRKRRACKPLAQGAGFYCGPPGRAHVVCGCVGS